ncbi:hypothetical protein NM208_g13124 [Fusarium decemcellulare]|uniref:Uncharacterized protein n=1 Tax=Fusarium decemcellulare TaxID=57161 RepID=A0ACC1RPJ9_9HYPO|nr:hypothetical protein NM208_g13124 [Fusarium decemcellulare]
MLSRTRAVLNEILGLAQVISACFMAWKALSLWADTPFPALVVTTESMVPAFYPGDVLFISNNKNPATVGDLPESEDLDQRQLILTKGDNNEVDDVSLYPDGQSYIYRHQILGFVRGYIPWLGWLVILLQNPLHVLTLLDALYQPTEEMVLEEQDDLDLKVNQY